MNVFLNAHDYASNLTRQTVKNISKSVLKIKCIITNISMRTCCVETLWASDKKRITFMQVRDAANTDRIQINPKKAKLI